jgi:hypothetical protein
VIPFGISISPRDLGDKLRVFENLASSPQTRPISANKRDSLMFVADLSYRERKRVGRG